jgi:hypothetical protein
MLEDEETSRGLDGKEAGHVRFPSVAVPRLNEPILDLIDGVGSGRDDAQIIEVALLQDGETAVDRGIAGQDEQLRTVKDHGYRPRCGGSTWHGARRVV